MRPKSCLMDWINSVSEDCRIVELTCVYTCCLKQVTCRHLQWLFVYAVTVCAVVCYVIWVCVTAYVVMDVLPATCQVLGLVVASRWCGHSVAQRSFRIEQGLVMHWEMCCLLTCLLLSLCLSD